MSELALLEELKVVIDEIAECDGEPDGEQAAEVRRLTGIDWPEAELRRLCRDYWDGPRTLNELAYYLLHKEWPEKP